MDSNTETLPLVDESLDEAEESQAGASAGEREEQSGEPERPSGRKVVSEHGHNVWEGSVEPGDLELDDTERRMRALAEDGANAPGSEGAEPAGSLELTDDTETGFDPYNSSDREDK